MTLLQLNGKHVRLRAELDVAHRVASSDQHIRRLDTEMTSIEKAIAEAQPLDEQTNDYFPAFLADGSDGVLLGSLNQL